MPAIRVENLFKSFRRGFWLKNSEVLRGVSFEVPQGGITGFVGQNGSGKTTTLKCALRLVRADSGEVEILGRTSFDAEVKSQIGFLPERPYFQSFLKANEFLSMHLVFSGQGKDQSRIDEVLEMVGLEGKGETRLESFSKGMLQRVGLAQAIIHRPKLIIMDEPLSGLDPEGRHLFKSILKKISETGVTLFFSSHLLFDVQELCHSIVLLDEGKILYQGEIGKILKKNDNYVIEYRLAEGPKAETCTEECLQGTIDRIRGSGGEILSITKPAASLEESVHILREKYHAHDI